MTASSPAGTRLYGIDSARGLALIGMMAVHILPSRDADESTSLAYLLASGRASALFAVVAGIGLALANGRQNPPHGMALRAARVGVLARVPIIALIGLTLGELDSGVAIILVNYALLFLLSTLGLGWSIRRLLWVAAIWVVVVPVASHFARTLLPETTFLQPNFTALLQPITLLRELLLTGYYPVIPWLGYIWTGLAVGRLDLTSSKVARRLALAGGALAIVSPVVFNLVVGNRLGDLPIQFFGVTPTDSVLYLAVATPHSATPLDLLHTIGTSLFVVGGALLIVRVLGWLAAAGAMTLSLYTIHVLALATRAGIEERPRLLVIHVLVAFVAGWIWAQFVGRGPLEQLLARTSARARAVASTAIPRADRLPP